MIGRIVTFGWAVAIGWPNHTEYVVPRPARPSAFLRMPLADTHGPELTTQF